MNMNSELPIKKKDGRGGARPGAGRKAGGKNLVTIDTLLGSLAQKSNGKPYEDMLIEDFFKARASGDTQLIIKYHNLILNKVMHTLNRVEVEDSQDAIQAKQQAFSDALAKLVGKQGE
jgi:hypothetical protein